MKNYISIAIIFILLFFIYREFQTQENSSKSVITTAAVNPDLQQPKDYTASFVVYIHNAPLYFYDPQYQNLSEDVYIQGDNPNLIYIKKSGITWGNFFETLPVTLSETCLTTGTGQNYCTGQGGELQFYMNGKKTSNILNQNIQEGDILLISYGFESDAQIQSQLELISAN